MVRKPVDPDNPPITDEFFKRFRPVREVAPELIAAQEAVKRPGRFQTIKTPGGETLVVMPLEDFEDMRDAADFAKAKAALRTGEETLSADEALAFAEAPTPLHFWRRKRDLTQAALAEKVGIGQSYIAGLEAGDRKGDPALFKKLAAALNVPMEMLVAD